MIGGDAVLKTVLGPIGRVFENFAATPLDFLTEGDRTVAFGLYTGKFRSSGGELRAPFVHLWTVRDGMIVDFSQYTDSAGWTEAVLGSAQAAGP